MLITKSVFAESSSIDGVRIFTAGRETLDDGITEHPLLQEGVGYDFWWPELAPDGDAYWAWHKNRIGWDDFSVRYFDKLRTNSAAQEKVEHLGRLAAGGNVTVLCLEDCHEHCHRGLLVVEFQRMFPEIAISAG